MPHSDPSLSSDFLRSSSLLLAVCATCLLTQAALAQDRQPDAPSWGAGIGVAAERLPYIGAGNKSIAFPAVSYEGRYFRLAGNVADVKLPGTGNWTFALRGRYALGDGYEDNDAPILAGMGDRKGSFWMGAAATWNAGFARLSLEVLGDASGKSKGTQAGLGIERDFRAGSFVFTPRAAVAWVDRKYVDYYYGVTASEARSFRSAYRGSSTVNLQAGLRTAYLIDAKQSLFVDIRATALGKEVSDSPLVGKKIVPAVAMGYLYRF